jgi:ABC-type transport system involved in multi-copper enzyme maturation permease subunit
MIRILVIAQAVWRETLRRKDLYVLIILLLAFFLGLIALNIFGLRNLVGYVKETGLLLVWIFSFFLTIGVSVRQLPQEEKSGTIFPLLAKPVRRTEVLLGKWLGAWTVAGAATTFFYIILAGIVHARGGHFYPLLAMEAWILHFCFIGILSALGILCSTRLNSDAAATLTAVLSVSAFLLLPQIPHLTAEVGGWKKEGLYIIYYALPHLELFDLRQRLVHEWGAVNLEPFLMIILYGLVVTVIILLASWLLFRNKKFNRDIF